MGCLHSASNFQLSWRSFECICSGSAGSFSISTIWLTIALENSPSTWTNCCDAQIAAACSSSSRESRERRIKLATDLFPLTWSARPPKTARSDDRAAKSFWCWTFIIIPRNWSSAGNSRILQRRNIAAMASRCVLVPLTKISAMRKTQVCGPSSAELVFMRLVQFKCRGQNFRDNR